MALGNGTAVSATTTTATSMTATANGGGGLVETSPAPLINGTNVETLSRPGKQVRTYYLLQLFCFFSLDVEL